MDLLSQGRKVYVPLVLGKGSSDMRMVPVENWEEIQGFTLSKWKIPEPPLELALSREDGIEAGDIGLVIAPGCAFDSSGNRLGHGRGYYDSFLHRNADARRRRKLLPSVIVGLALNEQMVDSVPTADHDVTMDHVITPDRIFDCARALRH
jgi:5-formyltetrahydrofolate cyclo-ligase